MSSGAIARSRDSPNKKSAPVDETGSGVESYAGISVFLLYHSNHHTTSKKGDFFFGV